MVKVRSKVVYKMSVTAKHIYSGEASEVKASVEEFVKNWLEVRGEEDND